jgi:RNA-binding protein
MLTGKERSFLRALGNELGPILIVGKGGVTPHVVGQLNETLTTRELIKARVLPHTEHEVEPIAAALASQTGAEIVQIIGRNILFYRAPEAGKPRKIEF